MGNISIIKECNSRSQDIDDSMKTREGESEVLGANVDSEPVDHVGDEEIARPFPVTESRMSKSKGYHHAANGTNTD